MLSKLNNLRYNNICNKFIEILNNIKMFFENQIKENSKTFIYKSKVTIEDLLTYRFNYVEKGVTFSRIVGKINSDKLKENNYKIFKLNSISTKDNLIPSIVFKNTYNYLLMELDKIFKFNNKIIIIDGTYSNTNIKHNGIVETSMSLIFYDPFNSLSLDVNFTGGDKKNNEKIKLQEYISNNIDKFKNKIIILDKAYHCYEFFKFLIDNDIKFIIRMKDKEPINKNKKLEIIKNDIKIYKHSCNNIKTVCDKNKNKIKKEKLEIVRLATNIKNLKEDKIFDFYNKRWSIEENIKQFKSNFKFQILNEHKQDNYQKIFYCDLIEMLIKTCLIKLYNIKNNIDTKHKSNNDITFKLNENLIIEGIKDILIKDVINSAINIDKINNLFKTHFVEHQNKTNRSNPRISKIPFTKWYVKKYHELYKEKIKLCNNELKIIKVINNNDPRISQIKKEILNLKKEKKDILLKLNKT